MYFSVGAFPTLPRCRMKRFLLSDEQFQPIRFRQFQRLHRGHRFADEGGHPGPDGLAHHIHRYPAAGVEHALAQLHPLRQRTANGLIQRVVAAKILALVQDFPVPQHKAVCGRRG